MAFHFGIVRRILIQYDLDQHGAVNPGNIGGLLGSQEERVIALEYLGTLLETIRADYIKIRKELFREKIDGRMVGVIDAETNSARVISLGFDLKQLMNRIQSIQ